MPGVDFPTRHDVAGLVREVAAAQFGCITTAQLRQAGLGAGAIQHRVATGRLQRMHHGVYRLEAVPDTDQLQWMAGVLRVGEGAALRGMTAAVGRGFWKRTQPTTIELVCGRRIVAPGLDVAFSGRWDPDRDIVIAGGLPFTTAARMVIDAAPGLTQFQLTALVKEAAFWGEFTVSEFEHEATRLGGRSGIATARRAVAAYQAGHAGTRSGLEDRLIKLLGAVRLPLPDAAGVPIGPHEVDLVWFDRMLIVEVDGPGHRQPNSRRKDPARDGTCATPASMSFGLRTTRSISIRSP